MKKFFLFAAAIVAALTMNATVYDFSNITSADELTVTNATLNTSESTETKLVYDIPAPAEGESSSTISIVVKAAPACVFELSNGSGKTKAMAVGIEGNGKSYIEFSGKNGILTINNLTVGTSVTLHICAKGEKTSSIAATSGAAETDAVELPAKVKKDSEQAGKDGYDANGYYWKDATFTATGSTMVLKETANGYRVNSINIADGQGIENTSAAVKAEKRYENGQLVIIKNGVKYNALGTVIE